MSTTTKVLSFVVITVVVVALAGPMPTIVTGILVLILAGIVLSNYTIFTDALSAANQAVGGKPVASAQAPMSPQYQQVVTV